MKVYKNGVEQECAFLKIFGHAIMNPFLTAIAVWAIIFSMRLVTAIPLLMTMVPYLTPFIIYSWAALYFSGGSLMLLGSSLFHSKISAAGCALFASAAFLNALFVFSSHIDGYQWQAFNMILFGTAAMFRVRHLIKGEVLMWMRP